MNAPSLPGCLACGGTTHHAKDCSAHDANRVLTAAGGWCAPSAPDALPPSYDPDVPVTVPSPGSEPDQEAPGA